MPGRSPLPPSPGRGRLARLAAAVLAVVLVVAACGGDDEPELTFEERLAELEGRDLTLAEVADRAEIGNALCVLDDQVLDEIWQQLDDDQLAFQDIVVASLCPERAILYAGHTGRYVTEEAELSGVRTSTTRPTTTRPTTTRPTTTSTSSTLGGDGTTTSGGDGSDDPTSSTTPTTATTSAPTTPSTTSATTATTATTSDDG